MPRSYRYVSGDQWRSRRGSPKIIPCWKPVEYMADIYAVLCDSSCFDHEMAERTSIALPNNQIPFSSPLPNQPRTHPCLPQVSPSTSHHHARLLSTIATRTDSDVSHHLPAPLPLVLASDVWARTAGPVMQVEARVHRMPLLLLPSGKMKRGWREKRRIWTR